METSRKRLSVRLKMFFFWLFYALKDMADPDMGPDAANMLVLFCTFGTVSLIAIPAAMFIAGPTWWPVAAISCLGIYLIIGMAMKFEMGDVL